ncbi:hypothetical protein [Amycolatopsis alba]|uniref:Uncharacterized protein n=1 Tax=Amycolatopsis alba DSM 44262 TaxID=1125972 RepID=A0A229S7N7_AMYAL|nr:hypothetical protein [Amycolatopsis alba]OXM54918.1 hypothetical protein CFP75_01885 [Amycolatopsis alba DSM 44262]
MTPVASPSVAVSRAENGERSAGSACGGPEGVRTGHGAPGGDHRRAVPRATPGTAAVGTCFLSKIELQAVDEPTMANWRKHVFIATAGIADSFTLPRDRTIIMGSQIEVQVRRSVNPRVVTTRALPSARR